MGYIEEINETLVPRHTEEAVVLDLFAGCGGLALGFEAVGFKTIGFEMNGPAAQSYRYNLGSDCHAVKLEVGFDFPRPTLSSVARLANHLASEAINAVWKTLVTASPSSSIR
jgi:site-specific DNA-cytosine methylase